MDSFSQIALGAAVGEAVLGKKLGAKAAGWGALLGTLPDLDILFYPFLDPMEQLAFHRGISHSFFFAVALAPVMGWLIARIHKKRGVTWREGSLLTFLGILTHFLLDAFTIYPTQVFQPFSNYTVELGAMFIIDPLYTTPLMLGVLAALFVRRERALRRGLIYTGLALSTAYLSLALVLQSSAKQTFEAFYAEQGITYDHLITVPTPLNTIMWTGLALDGDSLWVSMHSHLRDDPPELLQRLPRNTHLVDDLRGTVPVDRVAWFSDQMYMAEQRGEALYMIDPRFGRADGWLSDEGAYIFAFRLIEEGGIPVTFVQEQPALAPDELQANLSMLFARIGF